MPNPQDPAHFAVDASLQVFLLHYSPENFSGLNPSAAEDDSPPGSALVFLGPSATRPLLQRINSADFLNHPYYDINNSAWPWLSLQPPKAVLCLYSAAGWGRNVDILIEYTAAGNLFPATAQPTDPYKVWLFGSYTGKFFARQGDDWAFYAPFYPPIGDLPIFSFAKDTIPLYTFSNFPDGGGIPSQADWPNASVVESAPGRFHVQAVAVDGQDDKVNVSDSSGFDYASVERRVSIVCLPIDPSQLSELRQIEGRDISLKVTVSEVGAVAGTSAELALLRFSRPQHLPEVSENHVRMDSVASADLLAGALRQNIPLFACNGPGVPLELLLAYSSESSLYYRDAAREINKSSFAWTPFGHGWGFSYGMRVLGPIAAAENLDGSQIVPIHYLVQDASGRIDVFTGTDPGDSSFDPTAPLTYSPSSAGVWEPLFGPWGAQVVLTATGNGYQLQAGANSDVYTFQGDGRLTSIQRPSYATPLTIVWTGDNFQATDSSGRQMTGTAGADGRIVSIADPAQKIWTFHYDGPSLTGIDTPDGHLVSFDYDPDNFVMAHRTDLSGRVITYSYQYGDPSTRLYWGAFSSATTTDPVQGAITHSLVYATGPADAGVLGPSAYSVTYKDPNQNAGAPGNTQFSLSVHPPTGSNRQGGASVTIIAPDTSQTALDVTESGSVDSETRPSGVVINVDSGGYLSSVGFPDGTSLSQAYSWDPNNSSRLTSYQSIAGETATYSWPDPTHLVVTQTSPTGGTNITRTYTLAGPGDYQSAVSSDGESYNYAYHSEAGRMGLWQTVTRSTGSQTDVKTFDYDPFGRVSSMQAAVETRTWIYDSLGRVTNETRTSGGVQETRSVLYDPSGLKAHTEDFYGTIIDTVYGQQGWCLSANVTRPDGSVASFAYTYDQNGNVVAVDGPDGHAAYQYDSVGQLAGATLNSSPADTVPASWIAPAGDPFCGQPASSAPLPYGWLALTPAMGFPRPGQGETRQSARHEAAVWEMEDRAATQAAAAVIP